MTWSQRALNLLRGKFTCPNRQMATALPGSICLVQLRRSRSSETPQSRHGFCLKGADVLHKLTLWLFGLTSACCQISCSQTALLSKLNLCLRSLVVRVHPDLPSTRNRRYAATSTRTTVLGCLAGQDKNRTCTTLNPTPVYYGRRNASSTSKQA